MQRVSGLTATPGYHDGASLRTVHAAGHIVVGYIEATVPVLVIAGGGRSQGPFDAWFGQTEPAFWGIDLAQPLPEPLSTLVFDGPIT